MTQRSADGGVITPISRRGLMKVAGAVAGAAVIGRGAAGAAKAGQRVEPPSTVTTPPRDFSMPTTYFMDPDVISVDPRFDGYIQRNNAIRRLWTGGDVARGPCLERPGPVSRIQ